LCGVYGRSPSFAAGLTGLQQGFQQMRRIVMMVAFAAALTAYAPMTVAQSPDRTAPLAATPTVNLTVEQRHIIKELVKDMKVEKASGDMQVAIGGAVPASVKQHPFPSEVSQKVPQVRNHQFFLKDDRVVIVSPRDNVIADVIE
jgi:hypothetical protein